MCVKTRKPFINHLEGRRGVCSSFTPRNIGNRISVEIAKTYAFGCCASRKLTDAGLSILIIEWLPNYFPRRTVPTLRLQCPIRPGQWATDCPGIMHTPRSLEAHLGLARPHTRPETRYGSAEPASLCRRDP